MATLIKKVTENGKDISFVTLSDSVYHDGKRLSAILSGIGAVKALPEIALEEWKFNLISSVANPDYNDASPAGKVYDDSGWNTVSIPHDYSIYNNFNPDSAAGYDGGFLDGGDAWYRKKLTDISDMQGKLAYLFFDGIYMEADVYVNGNLIKQNKWYNPFYAEISQYLNYDGTDILAVFVRNMQPNSRWYSGSGIIRPVFLVCAKASSLSVGSVKVSTPNLQDDYANGIATTVVSGQISSANAKIGELLILIKKDNEIVYKSIRSIAIQTGTTNISETITLNDPTLWDEHDGQYYTTSLKLSVDGDIVYEEDIDYGYRWFSFNPNTGFWLNGKSVKLKGVCLHHDLGCLGAEINYSAVQRQIRMMKDMGANAIRTSHNPSSAYLLDVCMKEGMMVVEEFFDCFTVGKKSYDFHRFFNDYYASVIENTVKRDRNNPAVIMWSAGNEIMRFNNDGTALGIAQALYNKIKEFDDRPVTWADNETTTAALAVDAVFDVKGYNYKDGDLDTIHANNPTWCIYGSETTSALSSRGIYSRDNANHQCSSYDDDYVSWGAAAATVVKNYASKAYLAGLFVWTGFDYIGEPTPFDVYPCKSSYFGICDLAGFPKDIYYMYQSAWASTPMIHILPHWNWASGDVKNVWVYSNCASIDLFLNETSLGKRVLNDRGNKLQYAYSLSYTPGTLKAIGYDAEGNMIAIETVKTAGSPYRLRLQSDKSRINGKTLAFVTCEVVDQNGTICPLASNLIAFSVIGGKIKGLDNGDATSVERLKGTSQRTAFNGKCLCVIQADKLRYIAIQADADGLKGDCIIIENG